MCVFFFVKSISRTKLILPGLLERGAQSGVVFTASIKAFSNVGKVSQASPSEACFGDTPHRTFRTSDNLIRSLSTPTPASGKVGRGNGADAELEALATAPASTWLVTFAEGLRIK
jgi:hypothetical protein